MFMFQTAAAKHSTSPWVQVSAPRKRRSPICCTAMWWSSVSLCLVWIRTASERRWTCQTSTSWGGKRYHLKVVCVILYHWERMWPCFLWSVQIVLQKVDGGCYVSFCIHSLRASKILKQVQMGPDTLPDPADLGLRCWLRLIRTKRSCRWAVMGQQCWWNQGVGSSSFRFDMILHQKTLWRHETMRTIEQGFKIDLWLWYIMISWMFDCWCVMHHLSIFAVLYPKNC